MPSDRRVSHPIPSPCTFLPHRVSKRPYPQPSLQPLTSHPRRNGVLMLPSLPTILRSGCLRYVGEWWTGHVGAVRPFRLVQRSGGWLRRKVRARHACSAGSHDPPSHLIVYVLTHTRSLQPCSSCRYEQFLQKRNPGAQNITYDVGDFNKWLDKQEVGMIA